VVYISSSRAEIWNKAAENDAAVNYVSVMLANIAVPEYSQGGNNDVSIGTVNLEPGVESAAK